MLHGDQVNSVVFSGAGVDSNRDGVVLKADRDSRRTPMGKQAAHANSGDQCSVRF
jgi:hypothetical protein